ncbi:MAG TPA: hypothetical protein VGG75_21450 [Trebonia sp.]|jgi:hypothetical protein
MTAAQECDSIRSTADSESVYDGRAIPAGMRGAVLDAKPDGSILAEFAFAPQTADSDGDFVQGVLTAGQYEVTRSYVRERCPAGPFAVLIRIAATYLHPECACPARLRRRAGRAEDDAEMRAFKDELREAILHPERLPGDELSVRVQHDYGSAEAFMEQLWRYLYGTEPVAEPGVPGVSRRAARPEGAALLYESVRTVAPVEQAGYDGQLIRVIPAGAEGIIRHTRPDGTCSAELVTVPRAEEDGDDDDFDGGLADVTLTDGQYEVIASLCQNWTLRPQPFATLIAIADKYLAPGANDLASLRQRAGREDDEEMRRFKDQLRAAIMHPGDLPGNELSRHVRHDDDGPGAFLLRLWRGLYGDEHVAAGGFYWNRHGDGPFMTLALVTATYLHPGAPRPGTLRGRASDARDPEMRTFKAQLRELLQNPGRLPDRFFSHLRHDCGSDEAFMERLWRYLYDDEPVAQPGTAQAPRNGDAGA